MPVIVQSSTRTAESWGNGERSPDVDSKFTHASSAEQLLSSTTSNDGESHYGYQAQARPWGGRGRGPSPPGSDDRSNRTRTQRRQPSQLIQTSFASLDRTSSTVFATKNGFIHACIEAYNEHHNLVLRPEDVWFAILAQLSAYINAHAHELQPRLVNHPSSSSSTLPKQELHIDADIADPSFDHGSMALQMTQLMSENLADRSLRDWILPSFTTTDKTDQAVASIIFMGTLQKYFSYSWGTRCGIPSVTLLGEIDDWAEIARRCASHLAAGRFGAGPAAWYGRVLRPILGGFIESFREPGGPAAERFWRAVVDRHVPDGSGKITYSGWITGFCYWDEGGRCLHDGGDGMVELSRGQVPMGFVKVPVTLLDNGVRIETEMVAGSVGIRVMRGVEVAVEKAGCGEVFASSLGHMNGSGSRHRWEGYDTIQPESGWFMYRVCGEDQVSR